MLSSDARLINRAEIPMEDGRVFAVQLAPILNLGTAITMHDITYLKKLDKIKNDFVGTVSNDLRSPLTAILGYVNLLERAGPVNEEQRLYIQRVQASVRSITSLVDGLLNLGRIEAGFDTRKEVLAFGHILQTSLDGVKKRAGEKGLQLITEIPSDLPPLYANPVQLRQVVDHLVDNAVKFSGENGTISTKVQVQHNQLILKIADTGIGIPPVDLPYIFDKFYRASNAPLTAGGAGLGLSIVRSIVEMHQGRIWVDSKLGEGTTVTVVLPSAEKL
jgi:two-component system NtrC family sensor kinase